MNKLKYLTDAAMTSAIALALLLFSHVTGLEIEEMFPFLIPIPIALYTMRYGIGKGLIPVVAVSSLSLIHNPLHGLFFVTSGNIIGLLYGYSLYKTRKQGIHISVAVLGSFLINLLTLIVFSHLLYGYSFYEEVQRVVEALFHKIPTMDEETQIVIQAASQGLVPSLIAIMSVVEGCVFHLAVIFLSKRIFHHETDTISFSKLKVPMGVTILYCLSLIFSLIGLYFYLRLPNFMQVLWKIIINMSAVLSLLYIFVSLIFFLQLSKKKNKPWIYFVAVLALIAFPFHMVVGIIISFSKNHKKEMPNEGTSSTK